MTGRVVIREALALAVTTAALVAASFVVGDETRDLLLMFGGGAVGYLGSRTVGEFGRARRTQRARDEVERFSGASIDWGRLHMPHCFLVAAGSREESLDAWARFEFEPLADEPRQTPDIWPVLERTVLAQLVSRAAADSILFEDDPAVDLVGVRVLPVQQGEPVVFRLTAAPTTYFRFAATANVLDARLAEYGADLGTADLRKLWEGFEPRELSGVAALPAPAKIGTVTVVVSSDGLVICQERGSLHQVGSRSGRRPQLHFVGEGMAPTDLGPDGRLSPLATARRGLAEELGIAGAEAEVVPTGLFFDGKRWQPVFCYLARVPETAAQLQARLPSVPHRFETRLIHPRVWSSADADTRALLTDADLQVELASNHAQMALFLALAYREGTSAVIGALNA